jgi:cation diffusion facilitator CzcD-associated flavoprotein CzcO
VEQQSTKTVIIGAGPAGLAVGACLQKKGHPFIILEKSDKIGSSWHNHYDRLHLHTDKKRSELPYFSYPDEFPKYPSRRQMINYLESYARHFDLQPHFDQTVVSARFDDGHWVTETESRWYESENLVVATGYNNKPHIPTWPGMQRFEGEIIHSSSYRNGEPFQGKKVLVVGFGNSGGEIAIDLCEYGADVSISIRSSVNIIPRDLLGLPILAIAIPLSKLPARVADILTAPVLRIVFGNLKELGLQKADYGPFEQIQNRDRIPLIDVGTIQLIRNGKITVYPGIRRFSEQGVTFTDSDEQLYDAVILATGYRPEVEAFLKNESLETQEEAKSRNLYFCGFDVAATGVLREIAREAKQIAGEITKKRRKEEYIISEDIIF